MLILASDFAKAVLPNADDLTHRLARVERRKGVLEDGLRRVEIVDTFL